MPNYAAVSHRLTFSFDCVSSLKDYINVYAINTLYEVFHVETIPYTELTAVKRHSTTFKVPQTGLKAIELIVHRANANVGDKAHITNVKLEYGSMATPFVPRPIAEELALCQRYYEKGSFIQTITPSNTIESGQRYETISFKVTKRIAPSVIITSLQGTPNRISSANAVDLAENSGVAGWMTEDNFTAYNASGQNLSTAGNVVLYNWVADAEL